LKWIVKGHSFGSKTEQDNENGLHLKAGSSMEFEIGLRKWAVLKEGLLSPAGESMKSSLTCIMGSFIIMDILQKGETFLVKNTTMEKTETVENENLVMKLH
jgi:hypothetical protein